MSKAVVGTLAGAAAGGAGYGIVGGVGIAAMGTAVAITPVGWVLGGAGLGLLCAKAFFSR
ncbi:MAG: hypothetical protein L6R43_04555 [Planctomycetes bacterium]|nr:hypothetical protein [Planctomycetota bacterium]